MLSCVWIVTWVRAVPASGCPEVTKNKLWHRIKGRDIVLLGKQCLIAIMICGSAAGRHAEPHSEVEESWLVIWLEDVVNLRVNRVRADDGAAAARLPFWKAAGRCCGGEVSAELCPCYTSIQSRPGLTQRDPQLLNPDSTLYTQSNAWCACVECSANAGCISHLLLGL